MSDILDRLYAAILANRSGDPATSYVAKVTAKGRLKLAQKFGEEAVETVIAAVAQDRTALLGEAADATFHLLLLLADARISLNDLRGELERREGVSGIAEKAGRKPS
jgi:phosphoribosyl-ATP pyrophosphohydrolase